MELTVGLLLNHRPAELYYWRTKNLEVDFVLKFGKNLWAIEVKSIRKEKTKGLLAFKLEFPTAKLMIVNQENYVTEIEKIRSEIQVKG